MGKILADPPKIKKRLKATAPLTPSKAKFLDAAELIRMNPDDTEAAFLARELVQCTLPHTNPSNRPAWLRKNGNLKSRHIPWEPSAPMV